MAFQPAPALHREVASLPFGTEFKTDSPYTFTNKLELVADFIAVAEEIERLHIEFAGAPWFPKYNTERLDKSPTSSSPILPVAPSRGRTRTHPQPPLNSMQHMDSALARINEAMAMTQQSPLGDLDEFIQAPISTPPSVLVDIATLQETVKRHDLRFTGLEQGMAKGFENGMGEMAEISRDLGSSAPPPSRGGPPRRSYAPRRNLNDVTCYACGSKDHVQYARDCKGTSFATLSVQKQEEVQGVLQHAPIGGFTMAVVWEQYAPNDSSQSLDEALNNLHRWSFGGPKTAKLQTAVLTALPQVNASLLPPSPSFKVTPLSSPAFVYSGVPLSDATSTCSP